MTTERLDIVVTKSGDREAAQGISQVGDAADKTGKQVDGLTSSLDFMKKALVAVGVVELANQYRQLSDTFAGIVNRLKLVTQNGAQLAAVEQQLLNVANATRGSFEETANLYTKLASQTAQLGIDQKDLIPALTTINQLIGISGATAEEAKAGLLQFSQGLASNRFQGDELRSVLEQLPALGQAIAKGLNTTTAGLRQMGESGQLTAKLVLDALAKSAPEVAKQFAGLTPTISQAVQVLKNNVLQLVGVFDQVNGIGPKVAQVILLLANNLGTLVKALEVAAFTTAAFYAGLAIQSGWRSFAAGVEIASASLARYMAVAQLAGIETTVLSRLFVVFRSPIQGLVSAFTALWAVIAANPLVAIITALGAAAAAVYFFGNQIQLTSDGSITLLGAVVGSFNFVLAKVQQLASYASTVFGPAFRLIGTVIKEVFDIALNAVTALVNYFAQFIPSLQGLSNTLSNFASGWVKAMQDASKATGDATLAAKDFGVGFATAANQVAGAAANMTGQVQLAGDGLTQLGRVVASAIPPFENLVIAHDRAAAAQKRAKEAMEAYSKRVEALEEETRRLALTTRNAFGDMVTVTDEWARRSGEAFNSVKDNAAGAASTAVNSFNQIADAANNATSAIQTTAQAASSFNGQSTFIDSADNIRKYAQAAGGDPNAVQNAVRLADDLGTQIGTPQAATTLTKLYQALNALPKTAAHVIASNFPYVNTFLQSSGLPTFQYGGSFEVGGNGGVDSQLVQFMATPGERVSVQTPEQQRRRETTQPQGRNIVVNMNVTTKDANSFRRSQNQNYLQLRAKLAGAVRA